MKIPHRYRNCINPNQTPKEIQKAIRYMDKIVAKMRQEGETEEAIKQVTMEDLPTRSY